MVAFQSTQPSQAVTDCLYRNVDCFWFQSTQPSQAVTARLHEVLFHVRDFNPHSPRRLWHCRKIRQSYPKYFNPHSPRRLWRYSFIRSLFCSRFQSTQPSQAVTNYYFKGKQSDYISIHTALAGCDKKEKMQKESPFYFNPHSPRRLWQLLQNYFFRLVQFQSTQPSQAVTYLWPEMVRVIAISIHTALAGCDGSMWQRMN